MLPLPRNSRDPRLVAQHVSSTQNRQTQAARPVQLLHWRRGHSSKPASTNYLFITNLNDNVTEAVLENELSRFGTVRRVNVPTVDGRSAAIASVLLPSKLDPNHFVSAVDGLPLFGKKLSVTPDPEATKFRSALNIMQSPGDPTNHDSTPPTKDTRADSNSPNWSLASQSDLEQPLSPSTHLASEPRRSRPEEGKKISPPRSNKRPRTRYERDHHDRIDRPERRFPAEEFSHRHSSNPVSSIYGARPSHYSYKDEHRSTQHASQSRRHWGSGGHLAPSIPREHTCSSRSDLAFRFPYTNSRSRRPYHEMSSHGSRYHEYEGHRGIPYNQSRRERRLPQRRFDDVYRDHRSYNSSRNYNTYTSGKRPRSLSIRSSDRNSQMNPVGGSHIFSGEYPAIVLRDVPSDIFRWDILNSFSEFRAIHVQEKDTTGLYHVLFDDAKDRENALRYGCFTFSGVRIQPEKCLTRVDRHTRPASGGGSFASPHTPCHDRFVSSRRDSWQSEKRRRTHTPDSGGKRRVQTDFEGVGQSSVAPSRHEANPAPNFSSRNQAVSRQSGRRTESVRQFSATRTAERRSVSPSRSTSHVMKLGKESPRTSSHKALKNEGKASSYPPRPVAKTVKANPLESQSISLSPSRGRTGNVSATYPPAHGEGKEDQLGNGQRASEGAVPQGGFQSKDELFEAVVRHTIEQVSRQHAQLEVKRCEALVARSVFEFVSAEKAKAKDIRQSVNKNDVMHRVPRSANAFSEPDLVSPPEASPRKPKVSDGIEGHQVKGDGSARKRLRRSRFADFPDPETASLPGGVKALSDSHSEAQAEGKVKSASCLDVMPEIQESLPTSTAHVNESQISDTTALEPSRDSVNSKPREGTVVTAEESPGHRKKPLQPSHCSDEHSKDAKPFVDSDSLAMDTEKLETENGIGAFGSSNPSSLSLEQSNEGPPTLKALTSISELDKVLENKTIHRHAKSSLFNNLYTESGLPSLGLFPRRPPPRSVPIQTPEALSKPLIDPKSDIDPAPNPAPHFERREEKSKSKAKAGHLTRPKSSKVNVPTRKQSRKNGKVGKIKKDKKSRRAASLQLRKGKSSTSTVAAVPSGDEFELCIESEADKGPQASRREVADSERGFVSKEGFKRLTVEREGKQEELVVESDADKTDKTADDREGKCARTELYTRGQNKNKRRKRLHLESLSGKSALSSRQCRQESRLYRKGVSKIKPKNDNFINLNSLQQRWKKVQFDRSQIHGMGLYAKENIEQDEFVIEYIGDLIRRTVAELREKEYTRQGMGDSYLFRLNSNMVIDATRRGGIARFINHSCDPNVIARKITVDGRSTIAFYSKRAINIGEELTYDYKFEYEAEDKKIPCLCGAANCRKYLN